MADTLLIDLIKQLGSIAFELAKQEISLLVGVDEEVQQLQDRHGFVKVMLDDAEKSHAVMQPAEKLWLERLRDLYYEMDDVLDTWNTATIRADIEKEEGKPVDTNAPAVVKKKVCFSIPSLSCCFNLPLRNDVGHMISILNEKLDVVFKDKATYGVGCNRQPDVVERLTTTSFVDVSHIIGRDTYGDEPLRNLLGVGVLEERNSYCVISLVGMGGIGKTTIAQFVYNHRDVRAHFQSIMWVCVSHPFKPCEVAKAIIKEVDPNHGSLVDANLQTLLRKIEVLIEDKKFFLVLDDVWTESSEDWARFKPVLENGVRGSRILVTTRIQTVAKMIGSALLINLPELSDEDCWLIFRKKAFPNEEDPNFFEELGRNLASKCRGLPLAAKLLGSLMQDKRSIEQWNDILASSLWESEDIEEGLLAPLLLSYYELSSTMKRCFLYCAFFPKDYLFSRDQLVVYWMAQGYVESKANKGMEVIADEYFEKLAMRSFFQDFRYDRDKKIIGCKMHDIVHDFAQYMSKNESFEIDGDKKLEINCKIARHLRHLRLEITRKKQCLESIYLATCLRTLSLLSRVTDYEFEMVLLNSFQHFKCLRTLILDCPIEKLPDAVENLIHLRFLFISGNVKIEELPETFCNLCNLQTLKIENCGCFKKLPKGMSKLINLRNLMFNEHLYSNDVVFPKGIGKLIGLRTLKEFNIGDKNDREGCKLGELKNLNELRGTLKIHGMENVDEAHDAQWKDKRRLRRLVLMFRALALHKPEERMENDVKVLTALELPPNLQCLEIWCYKGNVYPNFPSLGQLQCLEVLDMMGLDNVKKVGDEFLGIEDSKNMKDYGIIFPNLKSLQFWNMGNWEEWIGVEVTGEEEENDNGIVTNPNIPKIMPRLQSLQIRFCPKLKSLPNYLLTAPLLKNLDISGSRLLQKGYRRGTGENWHKISHISTIRLGSKLVQSNGVLQIDSKTESGSEISDEDDVGASSTECVVDESGSEICDEEVEVDNDEGSEICEANR